MASSHEHHLPEPKTPMWLPALGATLFLLAGIWWAWSSSAAANAADGAKAEKPAASAKP
jgi:hypothetical protein